MWYPFFGKKNHLKLGVQTKPINPLKDVTEPSLCCMRLFRCPPLAKFPLHFLHCKAFRKKFVLKERVDGLYLWLSVIVISFKLRVLVRIEYYEEYGSWPITDNQWVIASLDYNIISINDDVTIF